jgi:predicted enzyme related to lactoylglutathione lyase
MNRYSAIILICISFCFGFGAKTLVSNPSGQAEEFKKVTGIGGIFFKSKDPKKLRDWYQKNLGLNMNQYGAVFEWKQATDASKKGFSQWSAFSDKTKYFEPSTKEFMINYRVADLGRLLKELKKDGVSVTDSIQDVEYGKFVHIMDLEGNKIELWEPNDVEYEKLGAKMGLSTTK